MEIHLSGLTPSRMVHFVIDNGEHRPAVITKVHTREGVVNLTVFAAETTDFENGTPLFMAFSVLFDNIDKKPGTWHWSERVE